MNRVGLCTYRILARAIYPGGASQRRVRIARCTRSMASDVAGSDKHRPFLGEETGSVLSDRAETLNDDPSAGQ